MGNITKILKNIFGSMIWIFFVIILGFAILHFLRQKFGTNIIGETAAKVESAAKGD